MIAAESRSHNQYNLFFPDNWKIESTRVVGLFFSQVFQLILIEGSTCRRFPAIGQDLVCGDNSIVEGKAGQYQKRDEQDGGDGSGPDEGPVERMAAAHLKCGSLNELKLRDDQLKS